MIDIKNNPEKYEHLFRRDFMKRSKKLYAFIIVALLAVITGVWKLVSTNIENKQRAELAASQEAYLAQDLERLSGQWYLSEYDANACCQALNNRYEVNNTYFACRLNTDEKKFEIYVVNKEEEISYINGSATRKTCTQKEKDRAIVIENKHKDECICCYVFE